MNRGETYMFTLENVTDENIKLDYCITECGPADDDD